MIKIFISVRNRLAITKKCIHALKIHSTIPHQIYVYDNNSNYMLDQHFAYFYRAFEKGYVDQVCFTKDNTTFNAFSKGTTCNLFALQHIQDPKKDEYHFLVMMDNDIIVTPNWDQKILTAWRYVKKHKLNNIKVIGQLPGGIKSRGPEIQIGDMIARTGKLGGSGLWATRSNFFEDVGLLDLSRLVGQCKKHDQNYWHILEKATNGENYILGLAEKLGIHCGKEAGSVCNTLTRNMHTKNRDNLIKFEEAEKKISEMDFKTFYAKISNDQSLIKDW